MKMKLFLLYFVPLTLLVFAAVSPVSATVVTFDDLSETGSGAYFSSLYQGLTWSNILCNNAILFTNVLPHEIHGLTNGLSGDYYGMVSASNVARIYYTGGEIDSPSSNFDFLSAYLTGFLNSNLNIEVQGFSGGTLLYDTTVVASATNSTLFTFNYLNISRLCFTPSSGQPAFDAGSDSQLIMDNFTFEFVPEPSPLLLATAGALLLSPLLKRKRG